MSESLKTNIELFKAKIANEAEIYWSDTSLDEFESDDDIWSWLASTADERETAIRLAEEEFSTLLGGLTLPASFVEAARELGYVDIWGDEGAGLYWSFSWVERTFLHDSLTESLFQIDPEWMLSHAGESRVAGMIMPDNPGDMPAYCIAGAFEYETLPDESLWLYVGMDAAWEGGAKLVPIGATYHEAIALFWTGAAGAIFLPDDEADEVLERLATADEATRRLVVQLLNGVRDLCNACGSLELTTEDATLEDERARIVKGRIPRVLDRLNIRDEALPFGRDPVTITKRSAQAKSRAEVFKESDPQAAQILKAAKSGDIKRIRELLDAGVDVNVRDEEGNTALHFAVDNGWNDPNLDLLELLIDRGADPNLKGGWEKTPLHALIPGGTLAAVKLLIDAGADVNIRAYLGSPVLFSAIENHKLDIVKVLLDSGADVNAVSETGWNPLSLANSAGTPEIVALLKAHGATDV